MSYLGTTLIIFGNSGSGESTLAKKLQQKESLAYLELDTLAWNINPQPERKPLAESEQELLKFVHKHKSWVIEGCYSDLIELIIAASTEIIYMNLSVD